MTYEPKGNDPMNQKVIHNNTSNNTSNISYKEDTKSEDFETQLDLLGDFLDNKQE